MGGHGHVTPNADGSRARCGGPGICDECSREASRRAEDLALVRLEQNVWKTANGREIPLSEMSSNQVKKALQMLEEGWTLGHGYDLDDSWRSVLSDEIAMRRAIDRPRVYLAHPVRPVGAETVEGNLAAAEAWLGLLISVELRWDVYCPWLAELRAWGPDLARAEREQRDRGMARNLRFARGCDGVVLAGPRQSPGMSDERDAVLESGGFACSLIGVRIEDARALADRGELARELERLVERPRF